MTKNRVGTWGILLRDEHRWSGYRAYHRIYENGTHVVALWKNDDMLWTGQVDSRLSDSGIVDVANITVDFHIKGMLPRRSKPVASLEDLIREVE